MYETNLQAISLLYLNLRQSQILPAAMVGGALGTVPYPGVLERGQGETSRKALEAAAPTLLSRECLAQPKPLYFCLIPFPDISIHHHNCFSRKMNL